MTQGVAHTKLTPVRLRSSSIPVKLSTRAESLAVRCTGSTVAEAQDLDLHCDKQNIARTRSPCFGNFNMRSLLTRIQGRTWWV